MKLHARSGSIPLFLVLAAGLGNQWSAAEIYRIERSVLARSNEIETVRMMVHFVDVGDDEVTFRLGFQNTSREKISGFGLLSEEDFVLTNISNGAEATASRIANSLRIIVPAEGMASGGTTVGDVTFSSLDSTGVNLRVKHFNPLIIPIVESAKGGLPPVLEPLKIDATLKSTYADFRPIVLKLESMTLERKGEAALSITLQNEATAAIDLNKEWKFDPSRAAIIDAEGQAKSPASVSAGLKQLAGQWNAGDTKHGSVSYQFDNAFATKRMLLTLPGYGTVHLEYVPEETRFQVTSYKAEMDNDEANARILSRNASRIIEQKLGQMNRDLKAGRVESYLEHFVADLQSAQQELVARSKELVSGMLLEFPVAQSFPIGDDESMSNVRLLLRHRILGIPEDNPLVALVDADFAKVPDKAEWTVSGFRFVKNAPFWFLGYTQKRVTDHFLLFHDKSTPKTRVEEVAEELEAGYANLRTKSVPLEDLHIAVLVDADEHFTQMTGSSAQNFDGSSQINFDLENDRFVVNNRLMFISEANLSTRQERWGCDQKEILRHELVHLALARSTQPFTPAWLAEGAAVYFSGQLKSATHQAFRESEGLAKVDLLSLSGKGAMREQDPGGPVELAYSGEAVRWLGNKFGDRRILQFFSSFGQLTSERIKQLPAEPQQQGMSGSARVAELVLSENFGLTLEDLDAQVQAFLKENQP